MSGIIVITIVVLLFLDFMMNDSKILKATGDFLRSFFRKSGD